LLATGNAEWYSSKVSWPRSRDIYVVYDKAHCRDELVPPTSCQFLVRIHDQEGHALVGASFHSGQSELGTSDAFGRILRSLKSGENLNGIVSMKGLESARISTRCVRGDERDVEQDIVLRKPKPDK
jgi:hypothetical protein